jgi:hypothetical protein
VPRNEREDFQIQGRINIYCGLAKQALQAIDSFRYTMLIFTLTSYSMLPPFFF